MTRNAASTVMRSKAWPSMVGIHRIWRYPKRFRATWRRCAARTRRQRPKCQERRVLRRPRVRETSMSTSSLIVRTVHGATIVAESRRRMMFIVPYQAATQMQMWGGSQWFCLFLHGGGKCQKDWACRRRCGKAQYDSLGRD